MAMLFSNVLPVRPPNSRRVTPQPSPSQIAMEERGLERAAPRIVPSPFSFNPARRSGQSTRIDPNKPLPLEPESEDSTPQSSAGDGSRAQTASRRTSSVYSDNSSRSADSADSLASTISRIIELYTNLTGQWSDEEIPTSAIDPNLPILQPKAYRDTIAPLLQRRYSFDKSNSSLPHLPQIPTEPFNVGLLQVVTGTTGSPVKTGKNEQAPSFLDFSRSLRDLRTGVVSPLSEDSVMLRAQATDVSPISTPQVWETFSRPDGTFPIKFATIGLRTDQPDQSSNQKDVLVRKPVAQTVQQAQGPGDLGRPGPTIRIPPSHLKAAMQQRREIAERAETSIPPHWQPEKHHKERPESANSDSTDSFVIYTGVTNTVKAMLKKKLRKRKAAKDRKGVMNAALRRYPSMKSHTSENQHSQMSDLRRTSIEMVTNVMRKMSLAEQSEEPQVFPQGTVQPQAAIPLTEYQKYGAQIWTAEAKEKRREQRQMQKMSQDSQHSYQSSEGVGHSRKTSQQSSGTVSSPQSGHRGIMRGLKDGLGRSSSQKRREKLKASIVVMRPTVDRAPTNAV